MGNPQTSTPKHPTPKPLNLTTNHCAPSHKDLPNLFSPQPSSNNRHRHVAPTPNASNNFCLMSD